MNSQFLWFCVALTAFSAGMAMAENPKGDPIHALMFPPELLIDHRQEIGLNDEQVEKIRAAAEEAGPKAQQRQMRLNQAMARLVKMLSAETVDEEAALKQLDEVLAIEKDLKHLHFRLMIRFRNALTAEQRQAAEKIQRLGESRQGVQKRLQAKLAKKIRQVEVKAQKLLQSGKDVSKIQRLMEKVPALIRQGKAEDAERIVDQALELSDDAPAKSSFPSP